MARKTSIERSGYRFIVWSCGVIIVLLLATMVITASANNKLNDIRAEVDHLEVITQEARTAALAARVTLDSAVADSGENNDDVMEALQTIDEIYRILCEETESCEGVNG